MAARLLLLALALSGWVFSPAQCSPPGIQRVFAFRNNATWPYSHNSGWALLPSGRIAVVAQASQTTEGAATQVVFLSTSDDGGATFSAPRVIAGNGSASVWGPVAFADGAVLRVFYAQAPAAAPTALCGDLLHISSPDGGQTWTPPEVVLSRAALDGSAKCPDNKPAQVAQDQWALPLMSVGAQAAGGSGTRSLLAASQPGAGMAGPWAPLAGVIPAPPHYNITDYLSEPAIASCALAYPGPPGTWEMLALLRNYEFTWAARSHDGGASWSAPFATKLANPYSKVDLAVWQGSVPAGPQPGALLLAHNPVKNCTHPVYCPRTPLAVSWSQDCGAVWSPPLELEPTASSPHGASYPTVGPCGGTRICVSYTLYDASRWGAGIVFSSFDASLLAPMT